MVIQSWPGIAYPEDVRLGEEEYHGGVEEDLAVGDGREQLQRLPHVVGLEVGRVVGRRRAGDRLPGRHGRRRAAADDRRRRHHVVRRQRDAKRDGVNAVEQVQPLATV